MSVSASARVGLVTILAGATALAAVVVPTTAPIASSAAPTVRIDAGLVSSTTVGASHVTSSKAVKGWRPNGAVHALATDGKWIYLGGTFSAITSPVKKTKMTAKGLIRISVKTGKPDRAWRPSVNGDIKTMKINSAHTRLYLGGMFTKVNGVARSRLAAVSTTRSAALKAWNPGADDTVRTMVIIGGNTILVGGSFLHIGTVARQHLARIDENGVLSSTFVPKLNQSVFSMVRPSGASYVVIGGFFTLVDGKPRNYIAAISLTTAAPSAWAPHSPCASNASVCPVLALAATSTTVFAGAAGPGGQVVAYRLSGGAERWRVYADGDVQALAIVGPRLFVGGHFYRKLAHKKRFTLGALTATTGKLNAFAPTGVDSYPGIAALLKTSNGIAVGGDTLKIGGTWDARYALFLRKR